MPIPLPAVAFLCALGGTAVEAPAARPGSVYAAPGGADADRGWHPRAREGWAADTSRRAMVTDRPDFTESALTVRRAQLEAGYTFTHADGTARHTLGEALLRVPAAASLELRVGLSSYRWTEAEHGGEGFTDASLGTKLELLASDGGAVPTVALLAGTSLPVGEVADAGFQPEGRVALAWGISDRVGVGANLGAARRDGTGGRFTELVGSVALGVAMGGRLGVFLETYGFEPVGDGRKGASFLDGGITLGLGADVQLDARIGTDLGGPAETVVGGVGVAVRR